MNRLVAGMLMACTVCLPVVLTQALTPQTVFMSLLVLAFMVGMINERLSNAVRELPQPRDRLGIAGWLVLLAVFGATVYYVSTRKPVVIMTSVERTV